MDTHREREREREGENAALSRRGAMEKFERKACHLKAQIITAVAQKTKKTKSMKKDE